MRRKDREVTDIGQIKGVLDNCKTCHLAMVDNGQPYVIPLNYAYLLEDNALTLYFHSAKEGRKIRILSENSSVCFEICVEGKIHISEASPCDSGYYYACVHGSGNAQFISEMNEKCYSLALLMKHQANIDVGFTPSQAEGVCIFKVISTDFACKMKQPTT